MKLDLIPDGHWTDTLGKIGGVYGGEKGPRKVTVYQIEDDTDLLVLGNAFAPDSFAHIIFKMFEMFLKCILFQILFVFSFHSEIINLF